MKAIPDGFELAEEPQHWIQKHPGVALSILLGGFVVVQILGEVWIDDMQQPRWDNIDASIDELRQETRSARARQSRETEQLATFNLERYRYSNTVWSLIAESANVKLPPRPKELDRAEDRVRDIQEGAN